MAAEDIATLVRRARLGDKRAWQALCQRYYPRWLAKYHGELGDTLRGVWDTEDLVQSACGEAIRDIKELRIDAAFYAWVSAIIKRKIAQKRLAVRKLQTVAPDALDGRPHNDGDVIGNLSEREETIKVLDAILYAFPTHSRQMAALYMKYFAGSEIKRIATAFELSERSVQRLLGEGRLILKSHLAR